MAKSKTTQTIDTLSSEKANNSDVLSRQARKFTKERQRKTLNKTPITKGSRGK